MTSRSAPLRRPALALIGAIAGLLALTVGVLVLLTDGEAPESSSDAADRAPIAVRTVPGPGATIASRVVRTPSGERRQARPAWVRRTGEATGIPERAIRSYADATLLLASQRPECGLRWTTLAGVGAVESIHGTFSGRSLRADGTSSEPIVGIALDGSEGVRAIPATEQGTRWHGDEEWEHAVGPMQFLPDTWAAQQTDQQADGQTEDPVDGDGDGTSDPFDLDDAAAAAGTYLCSAGGDLATVRGWNTGVFTYNNSSDYVREVAAAANAAAGDSRPRD